MSKPRTARSLLAAIANKNRISDVRMDHPDVRELIDGLLAEIQGDDKVGTILNAFVAKSGFLVHFEYEPRQYVAVEIVKNGSLSVRVSGQHSDLLAIHHEAGNTCFIVPRRYSEKLERYVELLK